MHILGFVLYWTLNLYFYVLIARLILDLARQVNPSWRPRKAGLAAGSVVYALTDAPLKVIRKVIRPIRIGGMMLDFSWTVLLIVVMMLRGFTGLL
jgi:YggT family protein